MADAETALANRGERESAYREVIDDKRAELEAAHTALNAILSKWANPAVEAATDQFYGAIETANEALSVIMRLEPWRGYRPFVQAPKLDGNGLYGQVPLVVLPEPLSKLLDTYNRATRVLLR